MSSAIASASCSGADPYTRKDFCFVQAASDESGFRCCVCLDTLENPVLHDVCRNLIDHACLKALPVDQNQLRRCPICTQSLNLTTCEKIPLPRPVTNELGRQMIRCQCCLVEMKREQFTRHYTHECHQPCPNKDTNGCPFLGARNVIPSHIMECAVACSQASNGCVELVSPSQTQQHMVNDCSGVIVSCIAADVECKWRGARKVQDSHQVACVYVAAYDIIKERDRRHEEALLSQKVVHSASVTVYDQCAWYDNLCWHDKLDFPVRGCWYVGELMYTNANGDAVVRRLMDNENFAVSPSLLAPFRIHTQNDFISGDVVDGYDSDLDR